jgi:2-polyprenyl-6-methoxyphenol hydroxylase-like FAD-dependent oxidoreductase
MRQTDIAIAGGGLAGSTAAAMLGRAGVRTILIDPHAAFPPDFRVEKLDASQIRIANETGLEPAIKRVSTIDGEVWIARFGRVVERRPNGQYGLYYDTLVNTIRAEIPSGTDFIHGKVTAIATSPDRQTLTLSTGEEISARLIVLANGLNIGLRHTLGIERRVISPGHSISIGFDVAPVGRRAFDFRALTYYFERATDRTAYLTLFPIGSVMRANLFVYRDMQDPWLRQMRHAPCEALFGLMPWLHRLTGDVEITDVKIRPVDLYVSEGHRQAGIVLVGDAFATSCPAAGTGCNKVFTDVVRLCGHHIPRWLESEGMGADKIAAFYDDEVKRASDQFAHDKAFYLRALSTDGGLTWRARRWARFIAQSGVGALRQARVRLGPARPRDEARDGEAGDAAHGLSNWKP